MFDLLLLKRALAGLTSAALIATPMPVMAQKARASSTGGVGVRVGSPVGVQRPNTDVKLSIGEGQLITLPSAVSSVWVSNPGAADVYVNNPRQIHLFGKGFGETTVFATSANGTVIYSANVLVSQNITSIDRMLKAAMPETDISVTVVGQIAVINGTVKSPQDSEQAQRLVLTLLNPGVNVNDAAAMLKIGVINRLKMATPLQVNLQVRFAEVSRNFVKDVGVNLLTRDQTSGFQFGIASGNRTPGTITTPDISNLPVLDASSKFGFPAGTITLPFDPQRGDFVYPGTGTNSTFTKGTANTTLGIASKLLGLDILGAIDLGERVGQVTTLANPNLTALSGETGTFLAGGEIPLLISQGLGAVSVEYKQYGVSLAYTPTVLSDGRISLRVRPEVSSISAGGGVTLPNGTTVPALTTRRAETTIELGSGESMMIAGLLTNNHNNIIDKAPGLGDVPILGALFRSNSFQRSETELVIVITPYLVKPVNASEIVLPTDGYKAPDDFQRIFGGQLSGSTPADRPKPSMAAPSGQPSVGAMVPAPVGPSPIQQQRDRTVKAPPPKQAKPKKNSGATAAPGFGF